MELEHTYAMKYVQQVVMYNNLDESHKYNIWANKDIENMAKLINESQCLVTRKGPKEGFELSA